MRTLCKVLTAVLALALTVACHGPNGGGGTPVDPPSITCGPDVTITGVASTGQVVLFQNPVVNGGTPPVATACLPANGSTFPIGTTTVTCTAIDAIARSAQCALHVTLVAQKLGAMTFVAFGDSITAGENGEAPPDPNNDNETAHCTQRPSSALAPGAIPRFIDTANSYPSQLLTMLQTNFPSQMFVMQNEGLRGEEVTNGSNARLTACVLPIFKPDVLLMLEGINDINAIAGGDTTVTPQGIVSALLANVTSARLAGVTFVFVGTILPETVCRDRLNCRSNEDPGVVNQINAIVDQTNALLRGSLFNATLVESNAVFRATDPTLASLIDTDGLHPLPAGYKVLAQAFHTAIINRIPITSLRRHR
jgi:lysophospholipase L1-like esterase